MDKTFGERLRNIRQSKRISQDALAEMLGKSGKSTVSGWENGRADPSLSDVMKLCEILQTTAAYLVDGNEAAANPVIPEGFVLVKAAEMIDLQRRVISQAKEQPH